jgi:hypothetical protein
MYLDIDGYGGVVNLLDLSLGVVDRLDNLSEQLLVSKLILVEINEVEAVKLAKLIGCSPRIVSLHDKLVQLHVFRSIAEPVNIRWLVDLRVK